LINIVKPYMFIKVVSFKPYNMFTYLQYVHILNLILVIIKLIYIVNKNCSTFVLHFCSFFFFTIALSFSFFELPYLSFFYVFHLSILQDSKYVAIYVRNTGEKLNITKKQIQKKIWYSNKEFTFPLKEASYINLRSFVH